MDVDLLLEEIEKKQKEINAARAYISATQSAIAFHRCPFEVGQHVISPNGDRKIIASISFCSWGAGYRFNAYKIKKDGNPHKYPNRVHNCEDYSAA